MTFEAALIQRSNLVKSRVGYLNLRISTLLVGNQFMHCVHVGWFCLEANIYIYMYSTHAYDVSIIILLIIIHRNYISRGDIANLYFISRMTHTYIMYFVVTAMLVGVTYVGCINEMKLQIVMSIYHRYTTL